MKFWGCPKISFNDCTDFEEKIQLTGLLWGLINFASQKWNFLLEKNKLKNGDNEEEIENIFLWYYI